MIVHNLLFPVNQVRVDSYYFCLMLISVIPQIETLVLFLFNLGVYIIPGVTRNSGPGLIF